MAGWASAPEWPEVTKIVEPGRPRRQEVHIVALGDQIPVIHGVAVGVQDALAEVGATVEDLRRQVQPDRRRGLPQGRRRRGCRRRRVRCSSTTRWPGTAFDALADKGVKVLIGGVEPSGGRKSDDTLAFYDNTARVDALYEAMSVSAASPTAARTPRCCGSG